MVLITRRDIPVPSSTQALARRGIGLALYDLVLLLPPSTGTSNTAQRKRWERADGLATLLTARGFRATSVRVPNDSQPAPEKSLTTIADDAHGILVVCNQGERCTGIWLTWMLGRASALEQRVALLPVARRDPWQGVWPIPVPLRDLPYVGSAKAVGDAAPSFWVVPAGQPPESRDAVNLDYWLHVYRSIR